MCTTVTLSNCEPGGLALAFGAWGVGVCAAAT